MLYASNSGHIQNYRRRRIHINTRILSKNRREIKEKQVSGYFKPLNAEMHDFYAFASLMSNHMS